MIAQAGGHASPLQIQRQRSLGPDPGSDVAAPHSYVPGKRDRLGEALGDDLGGPEQAGSVLLVVPAAPELELEGVGPDDAEQGMDSRAEKVGGSPILVVSESEAVEVDPKVASFPQGF